MNKRELKLKEYGISSKRYKELCGFCEQYPEWKFELDNRIDTLKSKQITDMPLPPMGKSDPTAQLAVARTILEEKCRMIENCAKETDPDLAVYIIKSVCYEQPFWYIRDIMRVPCSRATFYDKRKYFFYLLNKAKRL